MNKKFKQNSLNAIVFIYNRFTQQKKPQSSYFSAMQWATGLQLYYVKADPKVGEQHI